MLVCCNCCLADSISTPGTTHTFVRMQEILAAAYFTFFGLGHLSSTLLLQCQRWFRYQRIFLDNNNDYEQSCCVP